MKLVNDSVAHQETKGEAMQANSLVNNRGQSHFSSHCFILSGGGCGEKHPQSPSDYILCTVCQPERSLFEL